MKIRDYSFKHGIFDIKAEIHLEFPHKNTMIGGFFCLKKKNEDAQRCFYERLHHTDLTEFVKLLNKYSKEFSEKIPDEQLEEKKQIVLVYNSNSAMLGRMYERKSVDLEFEFKVVTTFWNGNILVKSNDQYGKALKLYDGKILEDKEYGLIPYSKEAENFLQDIADRLSDGIDKLEKFFKNDPFKRNQLSISEKIKIAVDSKQKLLE